MAQYLSKYLFEKYEYETIFAASRCGLSTSTSMDPEPVAAVFDDSNINLTILKIIFNYIKRYI